MDNQSEDLFEVIKKALRNARKAPPFKWIFVSKPRIAVLRFSGVIADNGAMWRGAISHAKCAKLIEKAFKVPDLEAVALVINSPGGASAQASLISSQILKLSQEKEKPVYAFVEDVAASGGYWLACTADEIYTQESSIVGSIGVISAGFGFEDFIKRYDIHRRIHTVGKDKAFLDPFEPEKDGDLKRLTRIQKSIHETFKDWVKERRGAVLKGKLNAIMEGDFWTGREAADLGLTDGIGDMRSVLEEKYGDKVKFVEIQQEKKFFSSFLPMGQESRAEWIYDAMEAVENRTVWQRFGL